MVRLRFSWVSVLLVLVFLLTLGQGCKALRERKNPVSYTEDSYDFKGQSFSLLHTDRMDPAANNEVPFGGYVNAAPGGGILGYYFLGKTGRDLHDPHIRIEYFPSKEAYATVEALFDWLKSTFLVEPRNGEMVNEGTTVITRDGRKIEVLEIHTPSRASEEGGRHASKEMLWAYIPMDDYFIGFAATSVDGEGYKELREEFLALLASYKGE